ncbi:hypothetical protein A2307_01515 [Candidatus Peregrinibacteria bacterium RIFOXYB2_FULL_33_20]|nr:MAG: hypothetical protein A2263_02465 [Candidatus Peregrinibacteria bacterium RIFOXYA2_FULL_33_21]OGJ50061.1 MAG: hypothetical protein A2307_01515 [Candidatus Peregrinibacteria bacterium RIFOXYB2_FULL_33_20]
MESPSQPPTTTQELLDIIPIGRTKSIDGSMYIQKATTGASVWPIDDSGNFPIATFNTLSLQVSPPKPTNLNRDEKDLILEFYNFLNEKFGL